MQALPETSRRQQKERPCSQANTMIDAIGHIRHLRIENLLSNYIGKPESLTGPSLAGY